ncbi:MAG: type 4a pilus biogenesis protein PilO [Candidatus Omnitrophica bacterium]|nr:type 4a pilus biogenesis protein PilO [Candidatus Omnitrophota bacterium]
MKNNVKEQFKEKFEKMDEKTIYIIFAAVLFSVFLLDYFVLMRPQLAALTKINPEIKILSDDIAKAKIDITKLDQYQKNVVELEEGIQKENKKVEPKEDVPLILEHISRLANKNGVKINQIMPNAVDSEIVLENNERVYYSLPIEVEAKAGYHNFGRFINAIENGDKFLRVKKLTMASMAGAKDHSVKLTLEAIVYEKAN